MSQWSPNNHISFAPFTFGRLGFELHLQQEINMTCVTQPKYPKMSLTDLCHYQNISKLLQTERVILAPRTALLLSGVLKAETQKQQKCQEEQL